MPKHIPVRTCIGCRQADSKRTLVRVVRTPEGTIEVDPTGKASGRGAYICTKDECLQLALAKNRLGKALRCSVSPADVEQLRQQFGEMT